MSSARLIWMTPDAEQQIEYCARVSSPENQERMEKGELTPGRLLRYCARKGHWSIFEMANACIAVTTTRDISAQILRHRSFSFQEFSTRYTQVSRRSVAPELRPQDPKNRQSSLDAPIDLSGVQRVLDRAHDAYDDLIRCGVARECARRVLPLCTPTKLYMNGTIRSWIHYFKARCTPETQKEHRELALQARALLARNLQVIAEAFDWNGDPNE